jgi:opacity protein-like surface antigen
MKKLVGWAGIAFFMLAAHTVKAQHNVKLDLNYVVGVPVGNLRTLTSNVSPRGWQAAIMYDINNTAGIGLTFGNQDFYQKYPRTVLHSPGSDISAAISNSIQVSPVMLKGIYQFGGPGHIRPYASLATGADFIRYSKYYGEFADQSSKVGFAAQAGVGINIPLVSYRIPNIHIGADYNYLPYKNGDANGLSFLGIKAGLSIIL